MGIIRNRRVISGLLLAIPLSYGSLSAAAIPVNLNHQKASYLSSIVDTKSLNAQGITFQETKRVLDRTNMLHVRVKQFFNHFPVWGGDAIVHIPQGQNVANSLPDVFMQANKNGSINGDVYLGIAKDVANTPNFVFQSNQAEKAVQKAITQYQDQIGTKPTISDISSEMIIYIDENDKNKANYAYLISFYVEPVKKGARPTKPTFIVNAQTLAIYVQWDEIKTAESLVSIETTGGGFGGNKKMGKLIYDGLKNNLARLTVTRDDVAQKCSLKNSEVTVKHYRSGDIPTFKCEKTDDQHNNVYWSGEFDAVNGGYSPDNDALFGGAVIKSMYLEWYKVPVLEERGKPMMLTMVVHANMDNAYWDGKKMTFGDGISMFYPLTSLGVAAHEISHGFTEQHSNLSYYGQSGGMNESFSDMAAQAAEVFAYQKNSWQIGPEIFKAENEALRYMDKPSKDCNGKKPGSWCSIDDASQYYNGLDVHFSSGVYNRFFYILGSKAGWDAKKAFDVMVHANMNYWTPRTTFVQGACGTIKAAKQLGYSEIDVRDAFLQVKINLKDC